jgi:hypothetical protein
MAIKEKKFSVEAEGVGELETKYDNRKKNIGPLPVSSLYAPSWPPPQPSIILLSSHLRAASSTILLYRIS